MKITDGKKTVEIHINTWDGSNWGPDWAEDYFDAGSLPYDEETGIYTVQDVDYCIDMANGTDSEGACCKWNEEGDCVPDDNVCVDVTEL